MSNPIEVEYSIDRQGVFVKETKIVMCESIEEATKLKELLVLSSTERWHADGFGDFISVDISEEGASAAYHEKE